MRLAWFCGKTERSVGYNSKCSLIPLQQRVTDQICNRVFFLIKMKQTNKNSKPEFTGFPNFFFLLGSLPQKSLL